MARIVVKIEPVEVNGKTYQRAVCKTAGCTLGADGGPWMTNPQSVKAAAEELAKIHRGDHRNPDRRPISSRSAAARPVQDIHLSGEHL
ncbi:hypothetical protein AB0K21_21660 [Streptosporangium sp. NPDC049248]|uniref:hypothetical protein n=1 Tax=Streptosporangium sp. NPDC049248 TaxID=3155651 RepID=UPI00341414EB